jgi:hypothetical protein
MIHIDLNEVKFRAICHFDSMTTFILTDNIRGHEGLVIIVCCSEMSMSFRGHEKFLEVIL